jgi:hypothetical protein
MVPVRGEARVLLSSPRMSNATDTRSLLRDPSVVQSAKGAAARRTNKPMTPHSVNPQKRPKKTPSDCNLPTKAKSGF